LINQQLTPIGGFVLSSSNEASFAERSSKPSEPTLTKTINLTVSDMTFPINYNVTGDGNSLTDISVESDPPNKGTLLINIYSQSSGKLIIELPRNVIDSSAPYIVEEDQNGHFRSADEIKNNAQVRTLDIDFDRGTSIIEIWGGAILSHISNPYSGSYPADYEKGTNAQDSTTTNPSEEVTTETIPFYPSQSGKTITHAGKTLEDYCIQYHGLIGKTEDDCHNMVTGNHIHGSGALFLLCNLTKLAGIHVTSGLSFLLRC
jgi:hypothetical protein